MYACCGEEREKREGGREREAMHVMACTWRSEDNLVELVPPSILLWVPRIELTSGLYFYLLRLYFWPICVT